MSATTQTQVTPSESHSVFLAIGTNVGDRIQHIVEALTEISRFCSIVTVSDVYLSKAMYVTDQDDFYNLVIKVQTKLDPRQLLHSCKQVEQTVGRQHRFRYGPREIDVDIIFYDQQVSNDEVLEIPHPRIQERDFVLVPIHTIAPDFVHPALNKSVDELLQLLPTKTLPVVVSSSELADLVQSA